MSACDFVNLLLLGLLFCVECCGEEVGIPIQESYFGQLIRVGRIAQSQQRYDPKWVVYQNEFSG